MVAAHPLDRGIQRARDLGHDMPDEPDPVRPGVRSTCRTCDASVLWAGGTFYGSAIERPCAGGDTDRKEHR